MHCLDALQDIKWTLRNKRHNKYLRVSEDTIVAELSRIYKKYFGTDLNLDNPQRLTEKIQWLKLYDSTPLKARLADKCEVRNWVKGQIGEGYLTPLLGAWDRFDDIDFSQLPDAFVLKVNHASGMNVIVKDKSDIDLTEMRRTFSRWLLMNYALLKMFEFHYGMIRPKILCEVYLGDNVNDYKLFCFNGEPEFVWVDIGGYPDHHRALYDLDWNALPFTINQHDCFPVEKPGQLNTMIGIARKLSRGFAFVRVDLMETGGRLYFGEMTFTPYSGMSPFFPDEYDALYGRKLTLPDKKPIPLKEIRKVWKFAEVRKFLHRGKAHARFMP